MKRLWTGRDIRADTVTSHDFQHDESVCRDELRGLHVSVHPSASSVRPAVAAVQLPPPGAPRHLLPGPLHRLDLHELVSPLESYPDIHGK